MTRKAWVIYAQRDSDSVVLSVCESLRELRVDAVDFPNGHVFEYDVDDADAHRLMNEKYEGLAREVVK